MCVMRFITDRIASFIELQGSEGPVIEVQQ
jgi:hypothetical protein